MIRTHTEVRIDDLNYARSALNNPDYRLFPGMKDIMKLHKKNIERIINNEKEGITPEVLAYTQQILAEIIDEEVIEWAKTMLAKISNKGD